MADTVGTTRFATFLATLFAIVALVLGVVGIYSVLAYVVAQRHREIAVRMALGADRCSVMAGVLRLALALAAMGIALGGLTAWMVTRALAGLFVGVSPHDPAVFVGAASVFLFVALAAASIPAFSHNAHQPYRGAVGELVEGRLERFSPGLAADLRLRRLCALSGADLSRLT